MVVIFEGPMFVEEILEKLADMVAAGKIAGAWHINFISNVNIYVVDGGCLSTNQSEILLKTAKTYTNELAKMFRISSAEMQDHIKNPSYRKTPYKSTSVKREVRYLGADVLAFRFKADQTVTQDLKNLKEGWDLVATRPKWNAKYRVWTISVTTTNLEKVMKLINTHQFDFDEATLEYITLCNNSKKPSVTAFVMADEQKIYMNLTSNSGLAQILHQTMDGEYV